jgi:hypothetical protein
MNETVLKLSKDGCTTKASKTSYRLVNSPVERNEVQYFGELSKLIYCFVLLFLSLPVPNVPKWDTGAKLICLFLPKICELSASFKGKFL